MMAKLTRLTLTQVPVAELMENWQNTYNIFCIEGNPGCTRSMFVENGLVPVSGWGGKFGYYSGVVTVEARIS